MQERGYALSWTVEVSAARQLCADLPLAGGVLCACAAAWLVLALFSMGEMSGDALSFVTRLMLAVTALCELALAAARSIACLRRGALALEYALTAEGLTLTERGAHVRNCRFMWADVRAVRRVRGGLKLCAGRRQMRVFCGERERAAIEASMRAARS